MTAKLSRDDLLKLIVENEGSKGLDLSKFDLSNADLSHLDLNGVHFGTDWRTPEAEKACLNGARLEKCNLRGADFTQVDLSGISFYGSDLADATLGVTNCTNTVFRKANMQGVNFHGARLINTDFVGANLRDSDYHSAYVADIDLTRAKLGDQLLFENETKYRAFLERHIIEKETIDLFLASRFAVAQQTYLMLKNVFLNKGQYEEASRAYFKERRTRRKTHLPLKRARQCYPDEINDMAQSGLIRKYQSLKFSMRHIFAYLLDWMAEMTCGYGEKPLRTIWWAFFTIVIFPFLYWLSGGIVSAYGQTLSWLDYLNYSFGAFATVGFGNFVTSTPLAQTLTSIEALLGISLLALLMFTLGNRISRS